MRASLDGRRPGFRERLVIHKKDKQYNRIRTVAGPGDGTIC